MFAASYPLNASSLSPSDPYALLPNASVTINLSLALTQLTSGYCEQPRLGSPVAQPADSYTNLLFVATGFHMLFVAATDGAALVAARRAAGPGGVVGVAGASLLRAGRGGGGHRRGATRFPAGTLPSEARAAVGLICICFFCLFLFFYV